MARQQTWSSFVLEYYSWYTANIVNISVFNALSVGSGFVAAVLLCIKRGHFFTLGAPIENSLQLEEGHDNDNNNNKRTNDTHHSA